MKIKWLVGMCVLVFGGFVLAGCDTGGGGGGDGKLLEVTHVTGFQGTTNDGSLLEIEVPSIDEGNHSFTLYINGVNKGTGELTISGGKITALIRCTNSDFDFSYSRVTYRGNSINLRSADDKVWVHWAENHPYPDDQGYYYGSSSPTYSTPQEIYYAACQDHPEDRPPIAVLNQVITELNKHKNTGVGAYVSRGNLIAYYFKRNK